MAEWITIESTKAFAGPIATVIASIVAAIFADTQACVARAQKNVAYDKLKLDTFEKRYGIYRDARELIEHVTVGRGVTTDANFIRQHYVSLDKARFFFDREIQSLLEKIRREVVFPIRWK